MLGFFKAFLVLLVEFIEVLFNHVSIDALQFVHQLLLQDLKGQLSFVVTVN
jgi:hypothetical protein